MKKLTVKKSEADQRLDIYLADKLAISRSQTQKLAKQGMVVIDKKALTPHYAVKAGDAITVTEKEETVKKYKAKQKLPKLTIVKETNDYLVIDKQPNVIIHGGETIDDLTITDTLEQLYPQILKVGDDPLRPGIVHRLDKDASGLLVVAKNNKAFDHLKKQFQARTIHKEYIALVYGVTDKEYDDIDFPISRSVKGYRMAAKTPKQGGRNAHTEIAVEQRFINYTLLKVIIKTGRPHQIRVHLSAYGHPLVGDNLYGTRKTKAQNDKLNLGRVFLHAHQLRFKDLDDDEQKFISKLPAELTKFLKTIK